MSTDDRPAPTSDSAIKAYTEARQADYGAFLNRVPVASDALDTGFLPGFREDGSYQQRRFTGLECPVGMLDNDFCGWCTQRRAECVGQEEAMERLSQLYGPADDE